MALLLMSMTSIQGGASWAKSLFPAIGVAGASTLRLTISTALLWILLKPWRAFPPRSVWPALIIYGASLAGMNLAIYRAVQSIPLGVAVTIEFIGPLLVATFGVRRYRDLIWMGLAVTGLAGLAPGGTGEFDIRGVCFAALAGLAWAVYIWSGKRVADHCGAKGVAIGSLVAALLVAPMGFRAACAGLSSSKIAFIALGVAVLSASLPHTLEMLALRRLPTKTFGILMSLEPAVATLIGFIALHEKLNLREALAIAAVVAASAGVTTTHDPSGSGTDATAKVDDQRLGRGRDR